MIGILNIKLNQAAYANKKMKLSLFSLFDPCGYSAYYKIELNVFVSSPRVCKLNITFQKGDSGQQYKLLVGTFAGERSHFNSYIDVISRNDRFINFLSIITDNNQFAWPEIATLSIKISAIRSMEYTGSSLNSAYMLNDINVHKPPIIIES